MLKTYLKLQRLNVAIGLVVLGIAIGCAAMMGFR
jgi:hypothetical protein